MKAAMRRALSVAALVVAVYALHAIAAGAQSLVVEECGPLVNSVGPFDYRKYVATANDHDSILWNVETNHFNSNVESLASGMTGSIGGDLSYVLRAFPNHHRALIALSRLSAKLRSESIPGMPYPATCWFERAIGFAGDDAKVREIFAVQLSRVGKRKDAVTQLNTAINLGANDINTYYNLGLLYADEGEYAKALEYAKKAYADGFPLPGLRDKLKRAGKWTE